MSAIQGLQSPTTYRAAAAAQLRSVIGRRGTTARQLAFAIGKDPSFVTKRTRGVVAMDMDDIEIFARALGVSPRELVPDWPPIGHHPGEGDSGALSHYGSAADTHQYVSPERDFQFSRNVTADDAPVTRAA